MYKNIFYFKKICRIGGTEQFLYEIAKKYKNYDITIFYDEADFFQLKRLRKFVRCVKREPGKLIKCEKIFFNFNIDMIDDVESIENYYCFVAHANFEELGYKPPINHPKLNHFIGVSNWASERLRCYAKEYFNKDIDVVTCHNPLTLEPKEKIIRLVSAGRLDDKVKGGGRTLKLIEALDRYCERTGRHYIWTIFTNPISTKIYSPNVVLMKPRVDVRPYIADADYVLQLSNDMETYCYTINEALGYGVPIVATPLSVLKELPVTENELIILDFDCKNVDEVAKQIFEKNVKQFKYNIAKDNWSNILAKGKSTYKEELKMKFLVEATKKYRMTNTSDNQLSEEKSKKEGKEIRYIPKEGEQWEVSAERKDTLVELGFAKVIKQIRKEKK